MPERPLEDVGLGDLAVFKGWRDAKVAMPTRSGDDAGLDEAVLLHKSCGDALLSGHLGLRWEVGVIADE